MLHQPPAPVGAQGLVLEHQQQQGYGGTGLGGTAEDTRPTLLVTTVDIGEGKAGRIELRLGDDPVDVARAFCARHNLPDTIVLPLAQHLEENLAETAAAAAAAFAHGNGTQYAGESELEVRRVDGEREGVNCGTAVPVPMLHCRPDQLTVAPRTCR